MVVSIRRSTERQWEVGKALRRNGWSFSSIEVLSKFADRNPFWELESIWLWRCRLSGVNNVAQPWCGYPRLDGGYGAFIKVMWINTLIFWWQSWVDQLRIISTYKYFPIFDLVFTLLTVQLRATISLYNADRKAHRLSWLLQVRPNFSGEFIIRISLGLLATVWTANRHQESTNAVILYRFPSFICSS